MATCRRNGSLFIVFIIMLANSACFAIDLTRDELKEREGKPGLWPAVGEQMWEGKKFNDSIDSTGAARLHAIGITGAGVAAAVIDTPYDVDHERIKDKILFDASAGLSLVNTTHGEDKYKRYPYHDKMEKIDSVIDDNIPYDVYLGTGREVIDLPVSGTFRPNGPSHGTHVAGTVSAMAPEAGLVLVHPASWKNESQMTEEDLVPFLATTPALNYVAEVAKKYNIVAVNNSWGDNDFSENREVDPDFKAAIANLSENSVIPVFASGNESVNAIGEPGYADGILSVGALTPKGMVAVFSNQDSSLSIMAPGVDIYSSVPFDDNLDPYEGTSMAAPHVTGAAALLASGARNAGPEEIWKAIEKSADVFTYDGSLVQEYNVYKNELFNSNWIFELTGEIVEQDRTQDEWRNLSRIQQILKYIVTNASFYGEPFNGSPEHEALLLARAKEALAENALYPDFGPLGTLKFRFLRVDKAYMALTESRLQTRAGDAAGFNRAAGPMLDAYSRELASGINQDTADIFQRLDAQSDKTLARAARQMSPQWIDSALQYGQLGVINIHRALGRRGEARSRNALFSEPASIQSDNAIGSVACLPERGFELWVEGFGSYVDRSGTANTSNYHGHFAGVSAGLEKARGDVAFGVFGSWADFRAKGSDGRSDGDWYGMGLYGRLDRSGWFAEASASYNYASYKSHRAIFIPGASFTTPIPGEFINLASFDRRTDARNRVNGIGARLAVGTDLWQGRDWTIGPRAEGSLSYGRVSAFSENGGGSLDLDVDAYHSTYAEGGLGVAAGKSFRGPGVGRILVSGKVMGMYGGAFGSNLSGRFRTHGSGFSFKPKRLSSAWCLPDAGVTWKVAERVDLSVNYYGRFGKRYVENAGALSINVRW